MERITVEDCIRVVPNRFDLVIFAAQRAREIDNSAIKVPRDNDKNIEVALREIAAGKISLDIWCQEIIKCFQKVPEPEEIEEEILQVMNEEQNRILIPETNSCMMNRNR